MSSKAGNTVGRLTITPDVNVVYDKPTTFEIQLNYAYGAVIVVDDATGSYDYATSTGVHESMAKYANEFTWPGSIFNINATKNTKLLVYYYPQVNTDPNFTYQEPGYDEYILEVDCAPELTVENYGNSCSFESNTTFKIVGNKNCDLTYTLLDLENKVESTATVPFIAETGLEFAIGFSATLKFYGTSNGKQSKEKFYIFNKEQSVKSVYRSYTENGSVVNNIEADQHFVAMTYWEGGVGSNGNNLVIGDFDFCPNTNSFIAGNSPNFTGLVGGNRTFRFPWYDFKAGTKVFKLHYKLVGANRTASNSYVNISIGSANIHKGEDSEGWLIGVYTPGHNSFSIEFNKSSNIVADVYFEIDYFEVINPPLNDNPYNYQLALSDTINENSIVNGLNISSFVGVSNIPSDPLFMLNTSIDGYAPTVGSSNLTIDPSYISDNRTFYDYAVYTQKIIYQSTQLDRDNGFIPIPYDERVSVYAWRNPSIVHVFNPAIEDFTLGKYKFNWRGYHQYSSPWLFTETGLLTPDIYSDTYIQEIECDYVYDITSQIVRLTIESFTTNTWETIGEGGAVGASFNCGMDLWYTGGNIWINPVLGEQVIEINLPQDYTMLRFRYNNWSQNGYTTHREYMRIKLIEFVGRQLNGSNMITPMPNTERWPNNQQTMPWVRTGNWDFASIDPSLANSRFLVSPKLLNYGDYCGFTIQENCVDGYIYETSATAVEYDYLGLYTTAGGRFSYSSGPRLEQHIGAYSILGINEFKAKLTKYSYSNTDYNAAAILNVEFPTASGIKTFDYAHRNSYTINYFSNLLDVPQWEWKLGSDFLTPAQIGLPSGLGTTVTGNMTSSLSITIPLNTSYNYAYTDFFTEIKSSGYIYYYVGIDVFCDWANDPESSVWHIEPYSTSRQYHYVDLPKPTNLEGTVTFKVSAYNAPFDISVYFDRIKLPIGMVPLFTLSNTDDIVVFPFDLTITCGRTDAVIWYTLDGSSPISSELRLEYTGPMPITEPAVINIVAEYDNQYSEVETKYYLDTHISDCKIFKHLFKIGQQYFVKFYSVPHTLPIIIGYYSDWKFGYRYYDGSPIPVDAGQLFIIGHATLLSDMTNSITNVDVYDSLDYNSLQLVMISLPETGWPKDYFKQLAVEQESFTFIPTMIPSIISGTYYHAIEVSFRPNFSEVTILYSVNNSALTEYTGDSILVASTSEIKFYITYPGIVQPFEQLIHYNIISVPEDRGLDFSTFKLINMTVDDYLACDKTLAPSISIEGLVYKTALAYAGLKGTLSESSYSVYVEYLKANNIYALFADEDMEYPFPFVFSLILNPGDLFTVPDSYAALYLNGKKSYNYTNDNLVCTFTDEFASGSEVTVISDYCLRLCIDILDSNKASVITPVWTNIPTGNYLSTGSSNALLSVDGITFTKVIKLVGEKLYVKGVFNQLDSVTYGKNIDNITIKLMTSEVISEYTV